jgi:hypothetical protein
VSLLADTRARAAETVRRRAALSGRPPRFAYTHYFIESEGLHSRVHLQNFWSTFWPQVHRPAVAHIQVFDDQGRPQGSSERVIPPFGSLFLEVADLLSELGSDAREGSVAIDLEPADEVRSQFHDLPDADQVEVKTPFWMAYYDGNENFMYVHSIDTLGGEVFGAPGLLRWAMTRSVPSGALWRSWRLLDASRLSDLQIVCMNMSPETRSTVAGVYSADDSVTFYQETQELAPRSVRRVRVPHEEIRDWPARHPGVEHIRIGLDPLVTANGKPYVIMRYADGPPSLHHG